MRESEHFTVYVIDPDLAIRDSVALLLESSTVDVLGFENALGFLLQKTRATACCLLVENALPDINGLKLIADIRKSGDKMPIVLLTNSTDQGLACLAAQSGITCIMRKPLRSQQLLDQMEIMRLSAMPDQFSGKK